MKTLIFLSLFSLSFPLFAQESELITTIDFVQILNDHEAETHYYYEHNWKALRKMAVEKGYIEDFQLLKTPFTNAAPFHLMLITTYADQEQYDQREAHFGELIKARGELRLLNEKKPGAFRKVIYYKEDIRHLE